MGTLKTGEKLSSAGASPLRASVGERVTAKQTEEAQAKVEAEARIEAERKAKEELGTAPTRAMSSSNPPPPAAIEIPKPAATPTLDAFKGELEAEKAAEAARLAREAAETGDMPVSVDVSLTGIAPAQAPTPAPAPVVQPQPKTFLGNPGAVSGAHPAPLAPVARHNSVKELPLSDFTAWGRFWKTIGTELTDFRKKHGIKLLFLGPIGLVVIGLIVYYGLLYSGIARSGLTDELVAPTTTTVTVPAPEPVAEPAPEPVAEPAPEPVAEPGLRGRRGERVTIRARDAFPVSCLTAWAVDHTDDAVYLCAPGQRRGNDMCDCNVTGVVP